MNFPITERDNSSPNMDQKDKKSKSNDLEDFGVFEQLLSKVKSALTQKQHIAKSFRLLQNHPVTSSKQHYAISVLASGTGVQDLYDLFFKCTNSHDHSEVMGCIDMFFSFCLYSPVIKLLHRVISTNNMKMFLFHILVELKQSLDSPLVIHWISGYVHALYNIGADIMTSSSSTLAPQQLKALGLIPQISMGLYTITLCRGVTHAVERNPAFIAIWSRAANFVLSLATDPEKSFHQLQQEFFEGVDIHNLLLFQIFFVQHVLLEIFLMDPHALDQQELRRSEIKDNLSTPHPIPRSFLLSTFLQPKMNSLLTPVKDHYKDYFLCVLAGPMMLLQENPRVSTFLSAYLKRTPETAKVLVRYVEANIFLCLKWISTRFWLHSCSSSVAFYEFYKLCGSWKYLALSLEPSAQYVWESFRKYDEFWKQFQTEHSFEEFTTPSSQRDYTKYEMAACLQEQGEVDRCCYLYCDNASPDLFQSSAENRRLQMIETMEAKHRSIEVISTFPKKCLYLCSSCNLFRYCSKDCQKKAWSTHKLYCRLTKEQQ